MSNTNYNSAKVISFSDFRPSDLTETPAIDRTEQIAISSIRARASAKPGAQAALAPIIEIERLYETAPGTASQMVSALELLKRASDWLAEAQKSDSPMDADRFVQRVQLTLPKLFACRSIGDGFGVIINSLHFAFTQLRGTPLTPSQLNVIWRVLRELRARPAMPLEQGIERVEELEAQGLGVDAPELADLLDDFESIENG